MRVTFYFHFVFSLALVHAQKKTPEAFLQPESDAVDHVNPLVLLSSFLRSAAY